MGLEAVAAGSRGRPGTGGRALRQRVLQDPGTRRLGHGARGADGPEVGPARGARQPRDPGEARPGGSGTPGGLGPEGQGVQRRARGGDPAGAQRLGARAARDRTGGEDVPPHRSLEQGRRGAGPAPRRSGSDAEDVARRRVGCPGGVRHGDEGRARGGQGGGNGDGQPRERRDRRGERLSRRDQAGRPAGGRGLQAQRRAGRDRRGGLPDPDAARSRPTSGRRSRSGRTSSPACRWARALPCASRPSRTAAPT